MKQTTIGGKFMSCRKGTKQSPQAIIDKIIAEHGSGITTKELANQYGKKHETIRSMIKRENKKKRQIEMGVAIKKKGRPAKDCVVTEDDKIAELRYKLNRKEYKIKQLEMENELLRDFLKETGRG